MRRLRPVVDAALLALVVTQMAMPRLGASVHEWAGIAMAALCCVHVAVNRKRLLGLARASSARRNARAIISLAVDALLVAWLVGEMLTGLSLARYVLPGALRLLPVLAARTWHSSLAYQGLVLVGVHAGMHLDRLLAGPGGRWRAIRAARVAWSCVGVALVPLGVASLRLLDFGTRLVPAGMMTFSDQSIPLALFLGAVACSLALFAEATHLLVRVLGPRHGNRWRA